MLMQDKISPGDLVPCPREVYFDDTLKVFDQVLRFDVVLDTPLKIQVLLDRRHKFRRKKSKPVAYFRISQTSQLIDMVTSALTMASVLALQNRDDIDSFTIEKAVDSILTIIKQDVCFLTKTTLEQVKHKRLEALRSEV